MGCLRVKAVDGPGGALAKRAVRPIIGGVSRPAAPLRIISKLYIVHRKSYIGSSLRLLRCLLGVLFLGTDVGGMF